MKVSTIVASAIVACVAFGSSAYAADTTTIDGVRQTTKNDGDIDNTGIIGAGSINNHGWRHRHNDITVNNGYVSGKGASASVSASGAASVVSVSSIAATINQKVDLTASGNYRSVRQYTENSGNVTNKGFIGVNSVSGNGASASISATGAASVVSVSSIK